MAQIPICDLSLASDVSRRGELLSQLQVSLLDVGFLYIKNHGIDQAVIDELINILPPLFSLPETEKQKVSKLNSPHFLGYNGYAEESTLGRKDLREQFDYATELPVLYDPNQQGDANGNGQDFSKLYWRLRGPNQWPCEDQIPRFRDIVSRYHDAVADLSYRFVHLIEEAFGIPVGTFDHLFSADISSTTVSRAASIPPQHRLKLLHYPAVSTSDASNQGVGPHKDSSGWLTFLYQPPHPEGGLFVLSPESKSSAPGEAKWLAAPPIEGTFVVNIGNAFEAATCNALRATIHKVDAPRSAPRYSVPFFMGLPLDLKVSQIRDLMPEHVKDLGRRRGKMDDGISPFLDMRWDELGESQLRKWIRSHEDVGRKWFGDEACIYYCS